MSNNVSPPALWPQGLFYSFPPGWKKRVTVFNPHVLGSLSSCTLVSNGTFILHFAVQYLVRLSFISMINNIDRNDDMDHHEFVYCH